MFKNLENLDLVKFYKASKSASQFDIKILAPII